VHYILLALIALLVGARGGILFLAITATTRELGQVCRRAVVTGYFLFFVAKLSPVLVRLAVGLEAGVGVALGLAQVLLLINLLCFLVVDCLIFHS